MRFKNYLDKLFENRVVNHSIFWLFVWLIAPITSNDINNLEEALVFRGVGMPVKIIGTYLLVYYQIPLLLQKRKYSLFALSIVLSGIILSIIYRYLNVHVSEAIYYPEANKESLLEMVEELDLTVAGYFFRTYLFTIPFLYIKFIKNRSEEKRQIEELKTEKISTELNFLKAQIHPHFLFNTLNNLYALTLDKSDKAPEVVAKLSEILDYILYKCKDPKVPLSNEVDLIKNYIELERLRYGDRLQVEFKEEVNFNQAVVAPMILISIIENAFKHGVSGSVQKSEIRIDLKVDENQISFNVFNTKNTFVQEDKMRYKDGIGAKNVRRQLELVYPNKYVWEVAETDETYEVNLILNETGRS